MSMNKLWKRSPAIDVIKALCDGRISEGDEREWVSYLKGIGVNTVVEWNTAGLDDINLLTTSKCRPLQKGVCEKDVKPILLIQCIGNLAQREYNYTEILTKSKKIYISKKDTQKCFVGGEEAIQRYKDDAVAVSCTERTGDSTRMDSSFSLVLGSSGSGKSLFALKGIADRLYSPGTHFTCMTFANSLKPDGVNRAERIESLKENLAKKVDEMIRETLELTAEEPLDLKNTLNLCVVLDEAGSCEYTDLLKTDNDINSIAESLKAISLSYTLVLAGTGLAEVTKDVGSERPFAKFRMGEWDMDNFAKLVGTETDIVDIVKGNPRLRGMVTNARCAYFLMLAVRRQLTFLPSKAAYDATTLGPTALTSTIVEVAHGYIDSNGLKGVKSHPGKAQVMVRAVLRALDADATNYRQSRRADDPAQRELKFPDYSQDIPEVLRDELVKLCNGVLDVHVETERGNVVFMNKSDHQKFAISVSPGMALVLAVLLGGCNAMTMDWSSFETTVAIGEMQEVLKSLDPMTIWSRPLELVHSQEQLPGNLKNKLRVPKDPTNTIIVNGPRAEYGDGISLKRLSQSKFTKGGKQATLHLLEELHKLGVTKNENYTKQQRLTDELCWLWYAHDDSMNDFEKGRAEEVDSESDEDEEMASGEDEEMVSGEDEEMEVQEEEELVNDDGGEEDERQSNYLASLLVAEQEEDVPFEFEVIEESSPAKKPQTDPRVKVVFATNAKEFQVPSIGTGTARKKPKALAKLLGLPDAKKRTAARYLKNNEADGYKKAMKIRRSDVGYNGELLDSEKLPKYVTKWLRTTPQVDFQFMFY